VAGYSWGYTISGNGRRQPEALLSADQVPAPGLLERDLETPPDASGNCLAASQKKYSPNNRILGNVVANTVTVTAHGDTSAISAVAGTCSGVTTPITGVCIPARPGNIDAGKVTLSAIGKTWT
jgi:hypothetical protein